jgi:two-component system sensor histidine kinase CiaH
MKNRSRSIFIFTLLFAYIILQFLWWEILLVKQSSEIINEKQKISALTSTDPEQLAKDIAELQSKKKVKIYMIAGEGTVFLLLLLYGIYRIKKAYEKESQLVNQQKNFLLSVTHELKTPIAATKLQLQTLLKHKQLNSEQQDQLLTNALNETNRLNRLIEDVLLANSAEKNELILNTEKVNVSELTHEVITNYFSNRIAEGALEMKAEKDIFIQTDKLMFPSIIINLVENAFKYSPESPKVKVELSSVNNKAVLTVSDNGIGIPASEKANVFQKFYRVGSEETRKTKGTGLGLYIVKKIVESNSGTISISDNNPTGSVFKVVI